MITPSFIDTSEKFDDWKPLLTAWVEQINRYCANIANDNPYWHAEQTNVAFLTGVAFQLSEWFSLTEFPSAKDNPTLTHTYGRNDAWLKSSQQEYFVEAKHLWFELNKLEYLSTISLTMSKAEQAARYVRIQPLPTTLPDNVHRVALVFVCPRYRTHTDFHPDKAIEQLQDYIIHHQKYDALAWTFPSQGLVNSVSVKSRGVPLQYSHFDYYSVVKVK